MLQGTRQDLKKKKCYELGLLLTKVGLVPTGLWCLAFFIPVSV